MQTFPCIRSCYVASFAAIMLYGPLTCSSAASDPDSLFVQFRATMHNMNELHQELHMNVINIRKTQEKISRWLNNTAGTAPMGCAMPKGFHSNRKITSKKLQEKLVKVKLEYERAQDRKQKFHKIMKAMYQNIADGDLLTKPDLEIGGKFRNFFKRAEQTQKHMDGFKGICKLIFGIAARDFKLAKSGLDIMEKKYQIVSKIKSIFNENLEDETRFAQYTELRKRLVEDIADKLKLSRNGKTVTDIAVNIEKLRDGWIKFTDTHPVPQRIKWDITRKADATTLEELCARVARLENQVSQLRIKAGATTGMDNAECLDDIFDNYHWLTLD